MYKRVLILIMLIVVQIGLAAALSTVNVQPVTQDVVIGKQFVVMVNVSPENPIAGMQTNILFDPKLVRIDSVAVGNLFTQNGDQEFYGAGVIDNTAGTVVNIFNVILGPHSVSTSGTFIKVTGTGLAKGTSQIGLTNLLISTPEATPEGLSFTNGSVVVKYPNYDVNEDGITNILDLQIVASHFGQTTSGRWDVNANGIVEIGDIVIIAQKL